MAKLILAILIAVGLIYCIFFKPPKGSTLRYQVSHKEREIKVAKVVVDNAPKAKPLPTVPKVEKIPEVKAVKILNDKDFASTVYKQVGNAAYEYKSPKPSVTKPKPKPKPKEKAKK